MRQSLLIFAFAISVTAQQRPPVPQQLAFAPFHAEGIYKVGETVGWTVTPGPDPVTYSYKWTVRRNNADVLKQGTLDLSSGKATIGIEADQPEMIYVAIEAVGAPGDRFTGGNTGRNNGLYAVGAAVEPEKLGLSTPRPADFDAFWDVKLAAQAKLPINPALTPAPTDTPGVEMSTFVLDALGSHAQGYIAKPAHEGRFPALVLLQYAGVYALNAKSVAARAAQGWLVIDVDSHDKLPSDPSGNIPRNYNAVGNTNRETSYFLNMYLRDSRALDYVMTRPDWDGKTIVLLGTSMGGQQSLVLAGLRPEKITSVLVNVPSGCDTNADLHGRKAGYPNWPSADADIMRTSLYFDPVNFASRIKAPVLAAMGFIDTTSPPAGIYTALNQIPGKKEPLPMIESEHNNLTPQKEQNWDARSKELLTSLLRTETAAAPAPDMLLLTDGEKLIGHLIRSTEGSVHFKSDMVGEVTVKWDKVKELRSARDFAVVKKDGERIAQGPLVVTDQKIQAGAASVAAADAVHVVEEKEYERAFGRHESLLKGWRGTVTAGASLVSATQKSRTFSDAISMVRGVPNEAWLPARNRTTLDFSNSYGILTQPGTPKIKTSILHAGAERDEYFSKSAFGFGQALFDHNFSQGLDLQQTYAGGIGWSVIKKASETLDIKAGMSYIRQQFAAAAVEQDLASSVFEQKFTRRFGKGAVLTQSASVLPAWNNTHALSGVAAAALTMPLYKKFTFSAGAIDNYLNNPPAGFRKNSVQVTTGLTYVLN